MEYFVALTYFKTLDDEAKRRYVSDVLKRCCEAWNVERVVDIVDGNVQALGFNSSTISMWVSRPTMPWDFVLTTAMKCKVSLDYLLLNANRPVDVNDTESLLIPISNALQECVEFGVIDQAHLLIIIKRIEKEINNETLIEKRAS